jgi:ABC-2 type transport system ATP-binding protein
VDPEIAIAATELGRDYGNVAAVDSIDLDVRKGEFFGFLGPNGAGKTTTIRMLTTLLRPTRGGARVAGNDVVGDPLAVRRAIGVVFQETTLDLDLTAEENLRFCARLYGLSRRETKVRVAEALSLFGLDERGRERVRSFSGGMRRALDLARGILHGPEILFLDEPTLGLDPPQRRRVWDHLGHLREEHGTTMFLTTHYLEEADPCDRIAIIDEGRVVVRGEPEQLKRQLGNDRIELDGARFPRDVGALRDEVRRLTGREPSTNGRALSIAVGDYAQTLQVLLPLATDGVEVRLRQATLDDVFAEATRRRDGDGDG